MLRTHRVDLASLYAILPGTSACTEPVASEAKHASTLLIGDGRSVDGTGAVPVVIKRAPR